MNTPSFYDAAAVQAGYPYQAGHAPMSPWGYNIVGQGVDPTPPPPPPPPPVKTPPPPTEESMTVKGQKFLQKETFGVKNQNILIGAAIIGFGYYGYSEGWFGGKGSHASGDASRHRRSSHHRRSTHHRRRDY